MGKEREETAQNRQIRVLDAAYQDIDEITDFIAIEKKQPLNAIRVAKAIFLTIDRIELNPFAFKECEEIPHEQRCTVRQFP